MHKGLVTASILALALPSSLAQAQPPTRDALIARAKSLELATPYVPPPGDPLTHHAAGFAKVMCSAVFITGLAPEFAAENVGYFTAPYAERARMGTPVVDRGARTVSVALPNGVVRVAKHFGSQGCITLPVGQTTVNFTPTQVRSQLPDAATTAWPMGDRLPDTPVPSEIDQVTLKAAVDAAFEPAGALTAAFVVTWKGRLIAERYAPGITATTPLESWSMGKSVTGTLIARLIHQGAFGLWDPAPIPEWQKPGDPRAAIRIGDVMRMSSGLRIRAPQDPDYDPSGPYPDHLYLYTGTVNSFTYAATRPLQWPPNTVGRYRNTDPVLANYLVRLAVEKRGEDYLSSPQRVLFDKIGVRTMVLETDPFGNFLTQGYEFASARDWARLGNLYLQDGVWNGERLLPEGYVSYVNTLAPAWEADGRLVYGGGFFWVNRDGGIPVPRDAFAMQGAGGQTTLIIPSHDLVVVRLGHFKGAREGGQSFDRALTLLMRAVPARAAPAQAAPAARALEAAAAARFARLALDCVHREYPNKIAHVLNGDGDVRPPRDLTPAFYGCYDWHSSVHAHWLLARLARLYPGTAFATEARGALAKSLTDANIATEVAYLRETGRTSFERPYGLAWLLQLAAELRTWDDPEARAWAQTLRPLEVESAQRLMAWLPKLRYPIRAGEHSQTAFAFGLIHDWAVASGDVGMVRLIDSRAREYYLRDTNCPLAYEPSGEDFLSPCLAEADFMRRVLTGDAYATWLDSFLPGIARDGRSDWLTPGEVTDRSDPKLAHIDGLNLSRAWMLEGIASHLPPGDPRIAGLRAAAVAHADAALPAVTGERYEGGHWLGTFAVYLTSGTGLTR